MSPTLDLRLERETFAPGETVKGTVTVVEGGSSRSLEVFLNLCEATNAYREVGLSIRSGVLHQEDLIEGRTHEFALELPPDAPPGFTSAHGRLWWEVDAKSDERGSDTHATREITVAIE